MITKEVPKVHDPSFRVYKRKEKSTEEVSIVVQKKSYIFSKPSFTLSLIATTAVTIIETNNVTDMFLLK